MVKKAKIGIRLKTTLLVIFTVVFAVLMISVVAHIISSSALETRYKESINTVASLKAQKIEAFFQKIKSNIEFGTELDLIKTRIPSPALQVVVPQDTLPDSLKNNQPPPLNLVEDDTMYIEGASGSWNMNVQNIFQKVLDNYDIDNIYLTDLKGNILFTEGERKNRKNEKEKIEVGYNFTERNIGNDGNIIAVGRDSVYFSTLQLSDTSMYVSAPVYNDKDNLAGVLIYDIDVSYIYKLLKDSTGLGETGEIILSKDFGSSVLRLNPYRGENYYDFIRKANVRLNEEYDIALQEAAKGRNGLGLQKDKDKETVWACWQYIPIVDWGITVQIKATEVRKPLDELDFWLFWIGLIILGISLALAYIFSRRLVRAIRLLRRTVDLLSQGILPEKVKAPSADEIGEIILNINELVERLKGTANFAKKIGQGDFEADYRPGAQDTLGSALLTMRDSIQQAAERDDERNWIVTGLAEIGDILPSITTIEELGELVSEYVTNKIGAVQGAFYTLNDENAEDIFIELNASYAYNKKKYLNGKFRFAEGLVGQAAIEQDTIVRTEIPDDYMTISSGILGDAKPKCILITPLIANENVYGVLEFAGFQRFTPREIEFVEEISELIARTVFNIKVKENTEKLLQESTQKGVELRRQSEILQQNAEVMEATQEELLKSKKELEFQIQEVQRARDRTTLLLENASEVITIYEADATIRYISPSVEKILSYTQDEMIGIRDIAYVHQDGVDYYEQMFKDLLENADKKVTIEYRYRKKTDEYIWVETTGTNLLEDPAIQGIVLNTRDITERKEAEREQRLRGQMQALSENSPDLIVRLSKEHKVFYINPIIETYTGSNKHGYLHKHLTELSLDDNILNSWSAILKDVLTKNQNVSIDMDFPSVMGDRVMQVNAIPEYNEAFHIESVLLVSHDITERKIIELEISQKNRKITESINYAKRIQEAILPDTGYIKQFLEESFILYKPRDVVSGDFPWFLQKEDDIYIAAVDCTGHGVPGALISLIGFFLLNNIVNVQQASSPAVILDMLDEEVTKTLRQDESDASTRDGMDISLCKINRKKRQIEYSGAHRPLYYMTRGVLHEIRGNKFPIGGAQYKNRGKFTNSVINYKEEDFIYLFSDGFPDQFGGPKNKKFSPRRIREIIKESANLELNEICRIMDKEFEEWRGNNKQTDDVLMIGIKF